jgi:mannose-1-phosphate guanylyltransferase
MHRIAVVMAGGSGERFWPLSRAGRPKQLLPLTHASMSMLEEAVRRIEPLVGSSNVFIATSAFLQESIGSTGLVPAARLFAEPDRRNTLGALVWVAAQIMALMSKDWMNVSVAVLTADHKIGDANAFRATVATAMSTAEETGGLVTIGVRPTRPETGFGYIEAAGDPDFTEAHRVVSFREKPALEAAVDMVAAGQFLWNSGMFFWRLRSFVDELTRVAPEVGEAVTQIAQALVAQDETAALDAFRSLPNISIDYALMEKAQNVYVVEAGFSWDDVGAWDALSRAREADGDGNVVSGNVLSLDTSNSVLINDSSSISTCVLGMEDVIVVTTDHAVLVCPKSRAQEVKRLVEELKARGSQTL